LNFSFQPPPVGLDGLPPRLRRLLPFALIALACHGLLVAWPTARRAPASRPAPPADDTPELLRLSRATSQAARLTAVPAATLALGELPPPPPSLLPQASGRPQVPLTAIPTRRDLPLASNAAGRAASLPPPPLPGRLEELAAALRQLQRSAPPEALAAADRDSLVALQRRQWWLSAAQEPLLQRLWQRAIAVDAAPDSLGPAAKELELRRLPAGPPPELGAGDWHGHSLVGRQSTLLLWRQEGQLWLLRLPRESGGETLTSS